MCFMERSIVGCLLERVDYAPRMAGCCFMIHSLCIQIGKALSRFEAILIIMM